MNYLQPPEWEVPSQSTLNIPMTTNCQFTVVTTLPSMGILEELWLLIKYTANSIVLRVLVVG
jgi:hypothetical protein